VGENSWIPTLCSTLIGQHVITAGITNNQEREDSFYVKIAGYNLVNYSRAVQLKRQSAKPFFCNLMLTGKRKGKLSGNLSPFRVGGEEWERCSVSLAWERGHEQRCVYGSRAGAESGVPRSARCAPQPGSRAWRRRSCSAAGGAQAAGRGVGCPAAYPGAHRAAVSRSTAAKGRELAGSAGDPRCKQRGGLTCGAERAPKATEITRAVQPSTPWGCGVQGKRGRGEVAVAARSLLPEPAAGSGRGVRMVQALCGLWDKVLSPEGEGWRKGAKERARSPRSGFPSDGAALIAER